MELPELISITKAVPGEYDRIRKLVRDLPDDQTGQKATLVTGLFILEAKISTVCDALLAAIGETK